MIARLKDFQEKTGTKNLTFVKWAGGKLQLVEQISNYLPKKIERYFEPFVGGGAMFFYIIQKYKPSYAYISDVNKELIITYVQIRDNVDELIRLLEEHRENHSKEYFYEIRSLDVDNLKDIEISARFIYLNKSCFNGLYRVNSKGKFNVPIGSYKNPSVFNEETLRKISKLLNECNVEIQLADYSKILNKVKGNDFVYLDPPYYPLKKSSFTSYNKNCFLEEEQKKLKEFYDKLDEKGVLVLKSNSDTDFIKKIYKGYKLEVVRARRNINSKGDGRGEINELLIKNY